MKRTNYIEVLLLAIFVFCIYSNSIALGNTIVLKNQHQQFTKQIPADNNNQTLFIEIDEEDISDFNNNYASYFITNSFFSINYNKSRFYHFNHLKNQNKNRIVPIFIYTHCIKI